MESKSDLANYTVLGHGGFQIAWFVSQEDAQDFIQSQPFPETYGLRELTRG